MRKKLGFIAAFVFVICLFSFISKPEEKEESPNDKRKWFWNSVVNNNDGKSYNSLKNKKIILEKNLMFSINLYVSYYISAFTKEIIPVSAFSTREGIYGSYDWKPASISISLTENCKELEYIVSGSIESKLLWLTFYSNYKNYTGIINVL